MEQWEIRLLDEQRQLKEKVIKLERVLNDETVPMWLDDRMRRLMGLQLVDMEGYLDRLNERIALL